MYNVHCTCLIPALYSQNFVPLGLLASCPNKSSFPHAPTDLLASCPTCSPYINSNLSWLPNASNMLPGNVPGITITVPTHRVTQPEL